MSHVVPRVLNLSDLSLGQSFGLEKMALFFRSTRKHLPCSPFGAKSLLVFPYSRVVRAYPNRLLATRTSAAAPKQPL